MKELLTCIAIVVGTFVGRMLYSYVTHGVWFS